ncbi:MAG: outer membrane beta-barrel protein [Chitinophagaceae bacterium]|nr:outer membrane beta-barrel protein [Chitinophagaceae bacterium]
MKSFKIIFFTLLVAGTGLWANAQDQKLTLNLNYSVNSPVGNFKSNLVNNTSWRGWNANLLYNVNHQFSAGLETGFNDFHQKFPREVYPTKGGGSISAVLSNSIQTVPLMVKGRYTLLPTGLIQPYVGLGIGGNIVSFNQYLGEFSSTQKTGFYFASSPEAGISVPFQKNGSSAFTLGGKYNIMPFHYDGNKNLDNWGVYAGIKFTIR